MELRRVDRHTYDVFIGTQWSDWARVRKGRSSTFVVSGMRLSYQLLKQLDEVLHPKLHLEPGNSFNLAN